VIAALTLLESSSCSPTPKKMVLVMRRAVRMTNQKKRKKKRRKNTVRKKLQRMRLKTLLRTRFDSLCSLSVTTPGVNSFSS